MVLERMKNTVADWRIEFAAESATLSQSASHSREVKGNFVAV
jgi:hypothetical protein